MKNPVAHLTTLFRNKIWNPVPTLQISGDDIVVFVIGPTGSGKSWFVKEATKSDLVKTSRAYHPCTDEVLAIRCELTEEIKGRLLTDDVAKNIVFIDTPSFLTTGCDHPDARDAFEKWMKKAKYHPRPEHVGVVYMHRVETDPILEPLAGHVEEFLKILRICGRHTPQRLLVVRSWDKTSSTVIQSKIEERSQKLCDQVVKLDRLNGKALMYENSIFQGEPEVVWNIVTELFRDGPLNTT